MTKSLRIYLLLPLALLLQACGGGSGEPAENASTDAGTPAAESGGAPAGLPRSSAPAGAELYFVDLVDGSTVTSPFTVRFGLDGMEVVPAGTEAPQSGHHHILIDTDLPPLDQPIPADSNHVHFGDGSTATELDLEPGQHTLQLLLGDHLHIPHRPPVYSEQITITVE